MSLVTSILVPVDIFLVSFMKNSDGKEEPAMSVSSNLYNITGSWKPWAENPDVRESLKNSIL